MGLVPECQVFGRQVRSPPRAMGHIFDPACMRVCVCNLLVFNYFGCPLLYYLFFAMYYKKIFNSDHISWMKYLFFAASVLLFQHTVYKEQNGDISEYVETSNTKNHMLK